MLHNEKIYKKNIVTKIVLFVFAFKTRMRILSHPLYKNSLTCVKNQMCYFAVDQIKYMRFLFKYIN